MALERTERGRQPLASRAVARHQVGEEVDGRGDPGQELVGRRAELEPLRHGIGRRRQLVGTERLEDLRARGEDSAVRAEELVRRAGEEVGAERGRCRRARARCSGRRRRRAGPRRRAPASAMAATSGRVPIRLEAAVTATSLVRSERTAATCSTSSSPVSGSKSAQRTVAPARSAAWIQGRTLASWSSRVTTTSSPGPQPGPASAPGPSSAGSSTGRTRPPRVGVDEVGHRGPAVGQRERAFRSAGVTVSSLARGAISASYTACATTSGVWVPPDRRSARPRDPPPRAAAGSGRARARRRTPCRSRAHSAAVADLTPVTWPSGRARANVDR